MVNSLLTAIVNADGDALVMHVGEQPYVVSPSGPVELSSRPLTLDAVSGMLAQLLPAESRRALDEIGAVEHDLPPSVSGNGERFTVVAARGGDEIWIEIRRHRELPEEPAPAAPEAPVVTETPDRSEAFQAPEAPKIPEPTAAAEQPGVLEQAAAAGTPGEAPSEPPPGIPASAVAEPSAPPPPEPSPAVVVPLPRSPLRMEAPARPAPPPRIAGRDRLLRLAAARDATTLYVLSGSRPSIRAGGEIAALEGEPVLSAQDVDLLLLDLLPEHDREAFQAGAATEWGLEIADVGRFRCQAFRDQRGPGATFRLLMPRQSSADQLGLSREVQALAAETSGLVLVAGPRSSGKSTLVSALVDLVNRTRADYVITVESRVTCPHENRGCLISQREVRGGTDEIATAARAAIRENPDVLVVEDLDSPAIVEAALDAAARGHLVIGAVPAPTAATAIGRILRGFPAARRERAQLMLAETLRGAVSQVLVRKSGGGRLAAREVILNTPAVASVIADGRLGQLPQAVDSGRKHGMVPLNDALAGFVQSGVVDVKDAYRQAYDRQAFLAVLRREGVDTSFAERLA